MFWTQALLFIHIFANLLPNIAKGDQRNCEEIAQDVKTCAVYQADSHVGPCEIFNMKPQEPACERTLQWLTNIFTVAKNCYTPRFLEPMAQLRILWYRAYECDPTTKPNVEAYKSCLARKGLENWRDKNDECILDIFEGSSDKRNEFSRMEPEVTQMRGPEKEEYCENMLKVRNCYAKTAKLDTCGKDGKMARKYLEAYTEQEYNIIGCQ